MILNRNFYKHIYVSIKLITMADILAKSIALHDRYLDKLKVSKKEVTVYKKSGTSFLRGRIIEVTTFGILFKFGENEKAWFPYQVIEKIV